MWECYGERQIPYSHFFHIIQIQTTVQPKHLCIDSMKGPTYVQHLLSFRSTATAGLQHRQPPPSSPDKGIQRLGGESHHDFGARHLASSASHAFTTMYSIVREAPRRRPLHLRRRKSVFDEHRPRTAATHTPSTAVGTLPKLA